MALNWTMLNDARQPVPIGQEHNVMVIDKDAEIVLSVPSHQSGGTHTTMKETGGIWLTDQRVWDYYLLGFNEHHLIRWDYIAYFRPSRSCQLRNFTFGYFINPSGISPFNVFQTADILTQLPLD
jgi:hypothetical protein